MGFIERVFRNFLPKSRSLQYRHIIFIHNLIIHNNNDVKILGHFVADLRAKGEKLL